jgi:hypothetical protein
LTVDSSTQHSDDEDFELWVIRTRIEQGLPPHVEDVQTLRQLAELLDLRQRTEQPASQDGSKSGDRR